MSEPFLILHRVRGEPAFDIAERHDDMGSASDPGPWWIIPTSGHRAYPYDQWPLTNLADVSYGPKQHKPYDWIMYDMTNLADNWNSWPDHYPPKSSPSTPRKAISSLLATLGLAPKAVEIKRRKL